MRSLTRTRADDYVCLKARLVLRSDISCLPNAYGYQFRTWYKHRLLSSFAAKWPADLRCHVRQLLLIFS